MPIPRADTPKTIGIVGSRRRDTQEDLEKCIACFKKHYNKGDKIVSGGCPQGGDKFAYVIARLYGLTIITHFPETNEHGCWVSQSAGLVRNTKIAEDCTILLAGLADTEGGTDDMVRKTKALKKKVVLW